MRRLLGCLAIALAGCSCSEGQSADSEQDAAAGSGGLAGTDAGTSGAAGAAGAGLGGWVGIDGGADAFETVGPEGLPDCGPGCRIALNRPVAHPFYYTHGYTADALVDTDRTAILYAPIGSSTTTILMRERFADEGLVEHHIHGKYVSFLGGAWPEGTVEVIDIETARYRIFYKYSDENLQVGQTAVNNKYVFWIRQGYGIYRAHLETGETERLSRYNSACDRLCTVEDGIICSALNGTVVHIDQETGDTTPLDTGGALQVDGSCSPDKGQVVWVDYRDPPGPPSTYDGYRSGGEVYVYEFAKGTAERMTFDSPDTPVAKIRPAIDGQLVVWRQPCASCEQNPDLQQSVLAARALVRFNMASGERCLLEDSPVLSRMSVHGRHVYGYWLHAATNQQYLVDLDLDDPGLAWDCQ